MGISNSLSLSIGSSVSMAAAGSGGGAPAPSAPENTTIRASQVAIQDDIAAVLANSSGKKMLIIGDSINAGTGAGTGGDEFMNGARARSAPVKAAAALLALDIPARADAWFGNSSPVLNTPAEYVAYNPSVVIASGWGDVTQADLGVWPLGGAAWGATSTSHTITFTPSRAADRFDIYYESYSGSTGFVVSDSSGTLATVANETGAWSTRKVSVTRATADLTPIVITPNASNDGPYIYGIDPWNSALSEVRVLSIAVAGWVTGNFTGNAGDHDIRFGMQLIAPDLVLTELGFNDYWTAVSLATAEANLQTIIDTFPDAGQILCIPNHATADDLPSNWRTAITTLAASNGLSEIDFGGELNTTTDLADTVHPSEAGATKMGNLIGALLAYDGPVPLILSGTPVTTANIDEAYASFTVSAAGGTAPYTYSLIGTWPTGITINSSTGEISGTPTQSGTFASLNVRVTDANSNTAELSDSFSLLVFNGPNLLSGLTWTAGSSTTASEDDDYVRATRNGANPRAYWHVVTGLTIGASYRLGPNTIYKRNSTNVVMRVADTTAIGTDGPYDSGLLTADTLIDTTFVADATSYYVGIVGVNTLNTHYVEADKDFSLTYVSGP